MTKFGDTVITHISANKVHGRTPNTIKGLAREMVGGDEKRVPAAKRNLHRWINGENKPSRASVKTVATILGCSTKDLEDDEEDDLSLEAWSFTLTGQPISESGPGLVADLMREIQRKKRRVRQLREAGCV